jgi:CopG family nickel-responsive transcriptional regulator
MERFTISLPAPLAREFDGWIAARAYRNRSEAVRDLLRAELERERLAGAGATLCIGSLSYVFNHHERDLGERLTALQHAHHDLTVATMHAHLDHDTCLETVILRGTTASVRRFADLVCAERGVRHGKLNLISAVPHARHQHAHDEAPHEHLRPAD